MRSLAFGAALFVTVAIGACSSSPPSSTSEGVGSQSSAIQGGSTDSSDPYAVGLCVGSGKGQCQLICSGALIAPNLVMTARHCVDQSPSQIDCASANFGALRGSTANYWVTTYYKMFQSSAGWHQASQILTTSGTAVCGHDMALIILKDNVPSSEAPTVTPVVQYSMTDHKRYSTSVTAIGYGITAPNNQDSGTRRIIQNVDLVCIPGDPLIDCGQQTQIDKNEFVSGDSTCEGDSGSSAYEQINFNKKVPVSFGVLSRGGDVNGKCVEPIYTRTDAWASWIQQVGIQAAAAGGYTAPSWTKPAPPPPPADAGAPDSGSTGNDGGLAPPPPGALGAQCGDNTDCDSGLCASNDGGNSYICSQPCDPSASDCPDGFSCVPSGDTGYCFPTPPDTSGTTPTQTAGCAVAAADPTKPVPWRTLSLAAVVGLALLRRRRRRTPEGRS